MANDYTPQQIEEILQMFFDVAGTRQYIGARYVPIFGHGRGTSVDWDQSSAYEPLSIVYYQGDTYTSRCYVPAGISIDNQDYWVITGRYNAQIEQYRQEVLSFQGQIDGIRNELESDYVPFPDPVHYPKYGTSGQVLSTLADGTTKWEDPVVPSDEQAETVIEAWLDAHPEATTTVTDNSITTAKLQDHIVTNAKLSDAATDLLSQSYSAFMGIFNHQRLDHVAYDNISRGGYSTSGGPLDPASSSYPYRIKASDSGYLIESAMYFEVPSEYYMFLFIYYDTVNTSGFQRIVGGAPNYPSKYIVEKDTTQHDVYVRVMISRKDNEIVGDSDVAAVTAGFRALSPRSNNSLITGSPSISDTSVFQSVDDLPENTTYAVLSGAISAGIQNMPVNSGCFITTFSNEYQVAVCFRNIYTQPNFYFRAKVSNVYRQWQSLNDSYDLYPTGDQTDRNQEIYDILNSKKICRLAPGDYYISATTIPSNAQLIGAGRGTRIIHIDTATQYSFMIQMNERGTIRDLCILGSTTAITPTSTYENATLNGIRIQGTGRDATVEFKCLIDNVIFENINGNAIFINKTGYNFQNASIISNVIVKNCNCGVFLAQYAEFNRITNCIFDGNYYGMVNNGGNNVITNCDFSGNIQGLLMTNASDNYGNSSHGSFIGCTFNHSDSNNGTAIELDTMIAAEMFVGCQIFYGEIKIKDSQGIVFDACNMGRTTPITVNGGGAVIFSNCMFRTNESPFTLIGTTHVNVDSCYYLGGSVVPQPV